MLRLISIALTLLLWSPASLMAAEAYPTRPIRIIVVLPAGGGLDTSARLVGAKMADEFGQSVVIDNRAGGASIIGTTAIANAQPDGYTIGMVPSTHVVNPFVHALPYDTVKAFEPITNVTRTPGVLATHPSLGVSNVKELISLVKNQPGKLTYAVAGHLTNGHISIERLRVAADLNMTQVIYRGGAPAVIAVLSGEAQLFIIAPPVVIPHIRSGRIKALATTGATRTKGLEDIPTFMESGFPDFETYEWFGMIAPAGIPRAVISKLSSATGRALEKEDVAQKLADLAMEPAAKGPEEFRAFMTNQMAKMKALSQRVKLIEK